MREGSVTVFFCLILTVISSLFFTMAESLRIFEMRLQSQMVTATVLGNAASEYQSYLWKTYGILGVDAGYGADTLDIGYMECRLGDFAWQNCVSENEGSGSDFFAIEPEEIRVTSYGLLTDDEGAALIRQGAERARILMAQNVWETWNSDVGDIEIYGELPDVGQMVSQAQNALEESRQDAVEGEEAKESSETQLPQVSEDPFTVFREIQRNGLWGLVLGERNVANGVLQCSDKVTERQLEEGTLEQKVTVSAYDRLCFDWYTLQQFSHWGQEKGQGENGRLSYETEYLIAGKDSDQENIESVILRILALREVQNVITIVSDPQMCTRTYEMALAVAGAAANPAVIPLVQSAVTAIWALVESVLDVRSLLDGDNIPLLKTAEHWKSQLGHLAESLQGTRKSDGVAEGVSYDDYLLVLVALQPQKELAYAAMDLMEAAVRGQSDGVSCRMDHMIYQINAEAIYRGQSLFDNGTDVWDPGWYTVEWEQQICF